MVTSDISIHGKSRKHEFKASWTGMNGVGSQLTLYLLRESILVRIPFVLFLILGHSIWTLSLPSWQYALVLLLISLSIQELVFYIASYIIIPANNGMLPWLAWILKHKPISSLFGESYSRLLAHLYAELDREESNCMESKLDMVARDSAEAWTLYTPDKVPLDAVLFGGEGLRHLVKFLISESDIELSKTLDVASDDFSINESNKSKTSGHIDCDERLHLSSTNFRQRAQSSFSAPITRHPRKKTNFPSKTYTAKIEASNSVPRIKGVLLHCMGNGGRMEVPLCMLDEWEKLGFASLLFNYRGIGESGGSPSPLGAILDIATCVTFLSSPISCGGLGVPQTRIVIVGHSIGGAFATIAKSFYPSVCIVNDRSFSKLSSVAYWWFAKDTFTVRSSCSIFASQRYSDTDRGLCDPNSIPSQTSFECEAHSSLVQTQSLDKNQHSEGLMSGAETPRSGKAFPCYSDERQPPNNMTFASPSTFTTSTSSVTMISPSYQDSTTNGVAPMSLSNAEVHTTNRRVRGQSVNEIRHPNLLGKPSSPSLSGPLPKLQEMERSKASDSQSKSLSSEQKHLRSRSEVTQSSPSCDENHCEERLPGPTAHPCPSDFSCSGRRSTRSSFSSVLSMSSATAEEMDVALERTLPISPSRKSWKRLSQVSRGTIHSLSQLNDVVMDNKSRSSSTRLGSDHAQVHSISPFHSDSTAPKRQNSEHCPTPGSHFQKSAVRSPSQNGPHSLSPSMSRSERRMSIHYSPSPSQSKRRRESLTSTYLLPRLSDVLESDIESMRDSACNPHEQRSWTEMSYDSCLSASSLEEEKSSSQRSWRLKIVHTCFILLCSCLRQCSRPLFYLVSKCFQSPGHDWESQVLFENLPFGHVLIRYALYWFLRYIACWEVDASKHWEKIPKTKKLLLYTSQDDILHPSVQLVSMFHTPNNMNHRGDLIRLSDVTLPPYSEHEHIDGYTQCDMNHDSYYPTSCGTSSTLQDIPVNSTITAGRDSIPCRHRPLFIPSSAAYYPHCARYPGMPQFPPYYPIPPPCPSISNLPEAYDGYQHNRSWTMEEQLLVAEHLSAMIPALPTLDSSFPIST